MVKTLFLSSQDLSAQSMILYLNLNMLSKLGKREIDFMSKRTLNEVSVELCFSSFLPR